MPHVTDISLYSSAVGYFWVWIIGY